MFDASCTCIDTKPLYLYTVDNTQPNGDIDIIRFLYQFLFILFSIISMGAVPLLVYDAVVTQKSRQALKQVTSSIGTLGNTVGSVGIGQHLEVLVESHQLIDKALHALVVAVIVASAVHQ